jgi:HEAT repeat protein
MTPLTVFVRTAVKTSAIFIGTMTVFLHPSLEWRSPHVGVTALQSPDNTVIDGLIGALKDKDAGVRREAASALGQLGNARAVPALIETMKDTEPDVRRRAANALGELGDERAITALTTALKDTDAGVRRAAVQAIAEISGGDSHGSPHPHPNPRPRPIVHRGGN